MGGVRMKPVPISPPRRREGYEIDYGPTRQHSAYGTAPLPGTRVQVESWWKRPATEARLGLITFGGGAIWAAKVQTIDMSNIFRLLMTRGPVEIAGFGLLIWLHAKWRGATRVR
jgi:hypothetical protein